MIKRLIPRDFRKLNLLAALILAVQAAALIALSRARYYDVTSPFAVFNGSTQQFDQGSQRMFDINLLWPVVVLLLLSAMAHLALSNRFRLQYDAGLKRGVNRYRWIEGVMTFPLLLVIIGLISGISDSATLLFIAGLGAITNLGLLAAENQKRDVKRPSRVGLLISILAGVLPWLIFALYAWGTRIHGNSDLPNFTYAVYAVTAATLVGIAYITYRQLKKQGRWSNYPTAERAYIVLGVFLKSAIAWLLFAGTLHR